MRTLKSWTRRALLGAVLLLPAACGGDVTPPFETPPDTMKLPLPQLGPWTYHNVMGGLYPGGFNQMPSAHSTVGANHARRIRPLDAAGNPSQDGRIVLLAVGMSNTQQEFAAFQELAQGQTGLRPELRLVNGARGGHAADSWDSPGRPVYNWVRDSVLAPAGLSEQQVQAAWVKLANITPPSAPSLPSQNADAYLLMERLGNTVRAMQQRYPNLQQVYLSSRTWGGYAAPGSASPEPYAYETGFAVKLIIDAQIRQILGEGIAPRAGDLGDEVAPWIAWGPYLWANGSEPRYDGLAWLRSDFVADGIHPSATGRAKVANLLSQFFRDAPWSRCWYLAGLEC
jgi:hypothetical protein